VVVNYSDNQSQCYVRLPSLTAPTVHFHDLMGTVTFERDAADLNVRGLYIDLPAWGYHVFEVVPGS
jgi:hypothetical protein